MNKSVTPELIDILLDKPSGFSVGSNRFSIYPATLGKTLKIATLLEKIGIEGEMQEPSSTIDFLMCVRKNREQCLRVIAIYTLNRREDISNECAISMRSKLIGDSASDSDVATLLYACMSYDARLKHVREGVGLKADLDRKKKVAKAKVSRNNFVFGGLSIYGALIDAACSRYGWELDYVLWGISYANLQLLLEDQISSIYLSDDEMKKAHISSDSETLNADDPKNWERIRELLKE